MNQRELVEELALRANVPLATAQAMLDALLVLEREGRAAAAPADPYDRQVVDGLIAAAERHPLGLDFLLRGYLGSVAAEFGAHAFTVEAARERLLSERRIPEREVRA